MTLPQREPGEDLARQEAEIRERRQRPRALLGAGPPSAGGPFSPGPARLLAGLPDTGSPDPAVGARASATLGRSAPVARMPLLCRPREVGVVRLPADDAHGR